MKRLAKKVVSVILASAMVITGSAVYRNEVKADGPEGYAVTFSTGEHYSVTVYDTQNYEDAETTHADVTTAIAKNSKTGEVDVSGSGQVNFTVVPDEGYVVDEAGFVISPKGSNESLKGIIDTGKKNTYRITKITGDIQVGISVVKEGTETKPYVATFSTGEHYSVTSYDTQDYDKKKVTHTNVTEAEVKSDSGLIDTSGDGQLNFTVVPDEGYVVKDVVITPKNYKNFKGPGDTLKENTYRITKITGDLQVEITVEEKTEEIPEPSGSPEPAATPAPDATQSPEPGTDEAKGYVVTFDTDEHARINVYRTKDFNEENIVERNAATAVTRDKDSGLETFSEGQVNFIVETDDGYMVDSVEGDSKGKYKNKKEPIEFNVENAYAFTKIIDNMTVTVRTKEKPAEPVPTPEPYVAVFSEGEHYSVTVYDTSKYDNAETTHENQTTAVARNDTSGIIDTTGDGQINFTVVPEAGYIVEGVVVTPKNYKNLKKPDETFKENTYRVTKVTGNLQINITVVKESAPTPAAKPTSEPTAKPTSEPTAKPTDAPTAKPTDVPAADPTNAPTATPGPTVHPTDKPGSTDGPAATATSGPSDDATATATPAASMTTQTPAPVQTPVATATTAPGGNDDAVSEDEVSVKKVTISSVRKKTIGRKPVIEVKWKVLKGITGYKVVYVTGKKTKTITVKGQSKSKYVIKNLKRGKSYSVYVYAYTTVNGRTYKGNKSKTKKIKL